MKFAKCQNTMLIISNFHSCKMHQVDSYGWPRNGTFDGVIGLFQKNKIQMTTHGVYMHIERLPYIEFAGDIFTPRLNLVCLGNISIKISEKVWNSQNL